MKTYSDISEINYFSGEERSSERAFEAEWLEWSGRGVCDQSTRTSGEDVYMSLNTLTPPYQAYGNPKRILFCPK